MSNRVLVFGIAITVIFNTVNIPYKLKNEASRRERHQTQNLHYVPSETRMI